MDPAGYSLDIDERRAIVISRMFGFWTGEIQAAYGEELVARLETMRASGRAFAFLCDVVDYPVQSFAISAGFRRIVRGLDRDLLVPTAIVTNSALVRIQIARVGILPNIRVFTDRGAALAWLAPVGGDRVAVDR